jgi:hypothetical protein
MSLKIILKKRCSTHEVGIVYIQSIKDSTKARKSIAIKINKNHSKDYFTEVLMVLKRIPNLVILKLIIKI